MPTGTLTSIDLGLRVDTHGVVWTFNPQLGYVRTERRYIAFAKLHTLARRYRRRTFTFEGRTHHVWA